MTRKAPRARDEPRREPPDPEALLARAAEVRARAYAPYSRFRVGAALLGDDGAVHVGCNVENASFGGTICAERMALGALIAAGAKRVEAIAVVGGAREPAAPCGLCRQMLRELVRDGSVVVWMRDTKGRTRSATMDELLPFAFGPDSLARSKASSRR